MCTATAVSLTVNQGHCQSLAIARVEKTQFAGLVALLAATLAQSTAAPWLTCSCKHQEAPCSNLQHTYLPLWPQSRKRHSHGCLAWTQVSLHVTAASQHQSLTVYARYWQQFTGLSMQAAATKLLHPDHVMLVSADTARDRTSLEGVQSSCNLCSTLQTRLPARHEGAASAA